MSQGSSADTIPIMLHRNPQVTHETVDGQTVLIDDSGKELITLNAVGSMVWAMLDGTRDPTAVVDEITAAFPDVARETIYDDVSAFLAELQVSHLVLDTSEDVS